MIAWTAGWLIIRITGFLLIPGLFWIFLLRSTKPHNLHSKRSLFWIFSAGVLVSLPAVTLEYFCYLILRLLTKPEQAFWLVLFFVGWIEESLKALAVNLAKPLPWHTSSIHPQLTWFIAAAIGFASIENLLYYWVFGKQVFFFRFFVTTGVHITCSSCFALALLKLPHSRKTRSWMGLCAAASLHCAYDLTLYFIPALIWLWVPLILLLLITIHQTISPIQVSPLVKAMLRQEKSL